MDLFRAPLIVSASVSGWRETPDSAMRPAKTHDSSGQVNSNACLAELIFIGFIEPIATSMALL
jgi:hypothetical protein